MALKFTQALDLTNNRILNVGSPSGATDAATKSYVDSVAQGQDWKASVRAASTANVDLTTPGTTLDGVTLASGDRILLKDQTAAAENGIYDYVDGTTTLTRSGDADTSAKVTAGMTLSVAEGTVNHDKSYILISDDAITLGTTALNFTLMNGGGFSYTAGNGLNLTGSAFAVVPDTGILVTGSGVAIDPSVVVRKFAANVGDGSSTSINLNHNFGTRDCNVTVYTNSSPWDTVFCEVNRPDINNVTIVFGVAPAAAAYRALITA